MSRSSPAGAESKPHLLYLAFFYPPSRSSGVYRAHATVKSFVRQGWDVTVITTDEGFFERATGSADWSLLDEIPPSVEVVRVPFDLPTTKQFDLRGLGWWHGNFPRMTPRGLRLLRRPLKAADVVGGRDPLAFDFVDRYTAWIDPVVKAGVRRHRARGVDAVLATGNPFSSFEAARLLSRLVGAPFAIDYRDPWALNVLTGEPQDRTPGTARAEGRIIDEAGFAVFVNEPTVDLYTEMYPQLEGKARVFFNGYDETSRSQAVAPVKQPLRFGMLGTATNLWPLPEFFEAWSDVRDEFGPETEVVLGGYLGYFAWSASPLEEVFPSKSEGFRYLGPIPKLEVGAFYDSIDIIVVLAFGGPIITAGKMYEAMSQGKPILCVQPADGGLRKAFEDHPFAVGVDPEPDAIRDGLRRVAELAVSLSVDDRVRVREQMERYERLTELDRLVAEVETMCQVPS